MEIDKIDNIYCEKDKIKIGLLPWKGVLFIIQLLGVYMSDITYLASRVVARYRPATTVVFVTFSSDKELL